MLLCLCFQSFALNILAQSDSLVYALKPIEVYGKTLETYTVGTKKQQFDSLTLSQSNGKNLTSLLLQSSAVYVREYGNGQLGSVSFRGTSPSQTAVLWNGININSRTLGQSDLGTIPLFTLDEVALQYGTSSSWFGTDAIGGTILLNNYNPLDKDGFKLTLQQDFGSFGKSFSGVKSHYRKGKLSGSTKIYNLDFENNFSYTDLRGRPQTQNNASVYNFGFSQSLNYDISNQKSISFKAWYQDNFREIQPTMSNLNSDENLEDKNLRFVLDYFDNSHLGNFNVKLGFTKDEQVYQGSVQSELSIWQYILALDYDKKITDKLSLKAGANWYHIRAESLNLGKPSENRNDIFASLQYSPYDFWKISFNLRQGFVTDFETPVTPALGSEIQFLKHFYWKTLISRGYRVPTFNDRFWLDGGRPEIQAENSWNFEQGLKYQINKNAIKLESEITYYRNIIDDWILWQPEGQVWRPSNVREVLAEGFDINFNLTYTKKDFKYTIQSNYAFAKSVTQNNLNEFDDTAGNQLPYTPKHRFNISQNLTYKTWFFSTNLNYTGLRFENLSNIEDQINSIPAFTLVNASLGKTFEFKRGRLNKGIWQKHQIQLFFRVNNIFDETYQNLIFRAMPQRNYEISLRFSII